MCDTMVIVERDRVFFAKNSDRDANEGQNLEWHPRRRSTKNARIKCTYIEVPDVEETFATLISRPFWMWGAEMGTNEHGVTIGNEAVFTKEPYESEAGLIGMDLLRLALERAATAEDACTIVTSFLETYGQGGGCGHESKNFVYHNSFIIADSTSAYVLETAGRRWSVESVKNVRSISNALTIPDFRDAYSDYLRTRVSGARERQLRTQNMCSCAATVGDFARILRDHGEDREAPKYRLASGAMSAACVHGGGTIASSQTTGSWISELMPGKFRHWATATSAPCTSLFKPVSVDTPVDVGPRAEGRANDSLWWKHERMHRAVMRDPEKLSPIFAAERDETERRWFSDPPDSAAAFAEGESLLKKWTDGVQGTDARDTRPPWARRYWAKRNKVAGLNHVGTNL